MKVYAFVLMAIMSGAALSGCAESRQFNSYRDEVDSWSYPHAAGIAIKDWFMDGTDILSVQVGAGETIGLVVQPTELLQFGCIFGDTMSLGYRDRGLGFFREVRKEYGCSWVHYRDCRFEPIMGTISLFERPQLFQGFPIRFNEEWHWMDLGVQVGIIFFDASVHVSPKQAIDFLGSTLLLPFEVFVRPALDRTGMRIPAIDLSEDDTRARLRRKYELELINEPEIFAPTEVLNDLMQYQ